MPIYEYECLANGHVFEELQKISDRPLSKCKVCGGKVKKLISSTSFQLKGGGWYKDGYASGNGGSRKKSGASIDACAGCESKCETKKKESK
jgi:putative FmdB family regulatory protein